MSRPTVPVHTAGVRIVHSLSLLLALAPLAAQGTPATAAASRPAGTEFRAPSGSFSLVLPPGWSVLTPDQARLLRRTQPGFPKDLLELVPGRYYHVGTVARWLEGGFDGRAVTFLEQEGALTVDEAGIAAVRESVAEHARTQGTRLELAGVELVRLGIRQHPAIAARLLAEAEDGPITVLRHYVPTGTRLLVVSLRARTADAAGAIALWQEHLPTLSCAQPPREAASSGGKLLYAAVLGALIGTLLLVLRRRRVP